MNAARLTLIALGFGLAAAAQAQVDPNRFVVAHPAGLALRAGHANHAHPAEVLHRAGVVLDPNQFLVQPPSPVRWVDAPVDPVAATARR